MFVDNEAAKAALTTGSSGNQVANNLLMTLFRTECDMSLVPWISKVPSHSSIADLPSRQLLDSLPGWPEAKRITAKVSDLQHKGSKAVLFQ